MHHRRGRPTLRVLQTDLTSDWESPQPRRALDEGRFADLHPLSELRHPLIAKVADSFGAGVADDNVVEWIASSTLLPLRKIRASQWRGGVWEDPETRVCWLLVAGLAKGGHQDRDDFYEQVRRETQSGDPTQWLPTEDDIRLLKQETAARLRTVWELRTQADVLDALRVIHAGGSRRIAVNHPVPGRGSLARIDLTVDLVRDKGYEADEVMVEVVPEKQYAGSELLWQLTVRVLISIEPPEQQWERFGDTYSNIGEPGAWSQRIEALGALVEANELALSKPGSTSHYTHRQHLAGKTIEGEAVRAICGVYFVPMQDHDALPTCTTCQERLGELPN